MPRVVYVPSIAMRASMACVPSSRGHLTKALLLGDTEFTSFCLLVTEPFFIVITKVFSSMMRQRVRRFVEVKIGLGFLMEKGREKAS